MMTTYDTREAVGILARASARFLPERHQKARATALRYLYEAVAGAATVAGYQRESWPNGVMLRDQSAFIVLSVEGDELWVAKGLGLGRPTSAAVSMAKLIEFDPDAGIFVGVEEDTYEHPSPGLPRRRRSAVSVVAEEIAKLLAQHVRP